MDQSYDFFTTDLYVLGQNKESQCGIDNKDYINKISRVNFAMVIREIACGLEHTLILTNEGQVYGFGSNLKGQLGVNNISVACSPIQVEGIEQLNCITIGAGESHSVALTDENQAYFWGDGTIQTQFVRNAQDVKCGLNFTIFQDDDGLFLYKNNTMQALQINEQITDFACSSTDLFYLDQEQNVYLNLEGQLMNNVQQIFSGYYMSLITEDNDLYYYKEKQLIKLDVKADKIDSAFGLDFAVILDSQNKAIIIDLIKQESQEIDQVFHSISCGPKHLVLIGEISKGMQDITEQQQNDQQQVHSDDDSILEGEGMSPIVTQKTQQDQQNTQQNNTFSFSIRKDIQLLHSIKVNHKETQTEYDIIQQLKQENEDLKKIQQQQKKNLEIQFQFQKTLQDQIARLTQENQMMKMNQNKGQLLKLIKQKQDNLKNLINEFHKSQNSFYLKYNIK